MDDRNSEGYGEPDISHVYPATDDGIKIKASSYRLVINKPPLVLYTRMEALNDCSHHSGKRGHMLVLLLAYQGAVGVRLILSSLSTRSSARRCV